MAASMWRIFTQGNEVYAVGRVNGGVGRLSFHFSGQIHQHLGHGERQLMTRPLLMSDGTWLHQIEWRFLIDADVLRPPTPQFKKKRDRAFLVNVPTGSLLLLNLLMTEQASSNAPVVPREFGGAEVLWHTRLAAGHHVTLVARLVDMDETNRQLLQNLRHVLNPRVALREVPVTPPYVEVQNLKWTEQGGNIILVVPMGHEGYRAPTDAGKAQ